MALEPQVQTPNQLVVDFAGNLDLREIFYGREVGDKIKLTFELQLMAKTQETATLAVEKVITDTPGSSGKDEAKPSLKEPIMASMKARTGKLGPHGRPPQTAENSAEPWMVSHV